MAPQDSGPLPPLNALRAFEAAARLGSFTHAAAALSVTQTAISHQVKLLEHHVGARLFRRFPRRIVLTEEGRAWAAALTDVFTRLYEANRRLRRRRVASRPLLSVTVLPSFASRWLVPRLGRFLERRPDIDLRLSPTQELADFGQGGFDVGIRYGKGKYSGLVAQKLCEDRWVVVCAPALEKRAQLAARGKLVGVALLHDETDEAAPGVLELQTKRLGTQRRAVAFTDSSMVVEAAVQGQGVALARWSLAMDDLSAGRLVEPFSFAKTPTGRAYFLVGPKESFARSEIAAFRDWLVEETRSLARSA